MKDEPLYPYLFEIAARPEAEGIIVSGGFGMRLKLAHLLETGAQMLVQEVPQPRATGDLDILLRVPFWIEPERASSIRGMLEQLGYKVILHSWHFRKPFAEIEGRFVKVDLQSRSPLPNEPVKVRRRQVGREMGTGLSGFETVEAFAIDYSPVQIPLVLDGAKANILVPHPYAWLNLKIAAAFDWLQEIEGKLAPKKNSDGDQSRRLKHVYDVPVLVAMMTAEELDQSSAIGKKLLGRTEAQDNLVKAQSLYGSGDSIAMQAANQYASDTGLDLSLDYDLFWTTLMDALGAT